MHKSIVRRLRQRIGIFAHRSGGLAAYHHLRNRHWLTVICFHRVLPPTDPRWRDADRVWTISVEQLLDCVAFAKEHFNPVSLDEVLDARRHNKALPPRPILFTFDDGWADNEEYALPVLEAANVPGLLFVTSAAVGKKNPFWFEMLRQARIGGRIDDETWRALWAVIGRTAPARRDEAQLESLITALEAFGTERREELLAPLASRLEDGHRHMLSVAQLKRLRARGFAIGAHGRTHASLATCENLEDELVEPRRTLEEILGHPVTTLACPHGHCTPEVLARARAAGYEMVFTGERKLSPVHAVPFTVGRTPITPEGVVDERGRFITERLANDLFRMRKFSNHSAL
jgi:peptidoglycan/xylan/chitin deacetylase (PgdA/CDA1 family)